MKPRSCSKKRGFRFYALLLVARTIDGKTGTSSVKPLPTAAPIYVVKFDANVLSKSVACLIKES